MAEGNPCSTCTNVPAAPPPARCRGGRGGCEGSAPPGRALAASPLGSPWWPPGGGAAVPEAPPAAAGLGVSCSLRIAPLPVGELSTSSARKRSDIKEGSSASSIPESNAWIENASRSGRSQSVLGAFTCIATYIARSESNASYLFPWKQKTQRTQHRCFTHQILSYKTRFFNTATTVSCAFSAATISSLHGNNLHQRR